MYDDIDPAVKAEVDEIEEKIREVLRRYPVKKAALFGSCANYTLREDSDVDVMVEIKKGERIPWMMGGLYVDLEEGVGREVDIVEFDAFYEKADKYFRASVEPELRLFYGD